MTIQFRAYENKAKVKGFGGLFVLKKKSGPRNITSDVSFVQTASADEGRKLGEIVDKKTEDSNTNLNQEVVNGNQLNSVEPNSTVENKLKRKKSETVKSLPKSKKTKIEEMKLFKANYF